MPANVIAVAVAGGAASVVVGAAVLVVRLGVELTASSSPLEHAASNAPAAVVLKPRSARRFSASRRVRRASAKSSATSSARYSRSAMRSRYRTARAG